MYTKKITDSDAFIELSSSAQALYFHLNQGADDDGFNNQIQNAMFKSHSTIDDLKVLMMKNFIIRFESGVIVIKHWRMHNTLRKDRYNPTNFQEEFEMLGIKPNGAYTLTNNGCQAVAKRLPQYSIDKNSIDKISIEEDSVGNSTVPTAVETMPALISFPTNKKDEFYHIYEDDVQAYRDLYPNVDIMQELRKMKGWLNANPTKRKTYKGLPRFINNWLAKEQDKPHRQNLAYASDYEETQTNTPKKETDAEMPKISREEYTSLMDDIEALMKGEA
jgi:hypothetical protein